MAVKEIKLPTIKLNLTTIRSFLATSGIAAAAVTITNKLVANGWIKTSWITGVVAAAGWLYHKAQKPTV